MTEKEESDDQSALPVVGHSSMKEVGTLDKRKIIAGICVVAGTVLLAVPFYYYYRGESRTDELTNKFEAVLEEKPYEETDSSKEKKTEENGKATINEADAAVFAEGDVIAIIEIERLGIRYPVVEGCASKNLNYAIGHMSETAGIGAAGNCVLGGHNGSRYGEFFTHLTELEKGDIVTLLDGNAEVYSYAVTDSFIVSPYDNSIKAQGESEELTLFTCAERGTKRYVVKCMPAE